MTMRSFVAAVLWRNSEDGEVPGQLCKSPENAHPPPADLGCFTGSLANARQRRARPKSSGEPDASWEVASKALGGDFYPGPARIAELEADLCVAMRISKHKDKEVASLNQLLVGLEKTLEQQSKEASVQQDRISMLERALSSQNGSVGATEKQTKLSLAFTGERQKAEERTARVGVIQAKLSSESDHRRASEDRLQARDEELRLASEQLSRCLKSRLTTQRLAAEREAQVAQLEQKLAAATVAATAAGSGGVGRGAALEQVDEAAHGHAAALAKLQERQLARLRAQLEEELRLREDAERQLAERQGSLFDPGGCVPKTTEQLGRMAREQVIHKDREVCGLQEQLSQELSKRREVQNEGIRLERQVDEKDRLLADLHAQLEGTRAQRSLIHAQPPPLSGPSSPAVPRPRGGVETPRRRCDELGQATPMVLSQFVFRSQPSTPMCPAVGFAASGSVGPGGIFLPPRGGAHGAAGVGLGPLPSREAMDGPRPEGMMQRLLMASKTFS